MSFIWGEICWNTVPSSSFESLTKDILKYPYDNKYERIRDNSSIGLLDVELRKPPYSQNQIHENKLLQFTLVADARLDYRKDLIERLNTTDSATDLLSDSELVLEAYKKWGIKCTQYLEGDWVFVVHKWDTEEVILARDPIGLRPLFFYQDENSLLFSTSIEGIRKLSNVSKEPSKEFYQNQFFGAKTTPLATPFKNIKQVPRAQYVVCEKGSFKATCFFEWDFTTNLKQLPNIEEMLREKILDAVKSRTYTDYPIGIKLSGGLDSTAIFSILRKNYPQKVLYCASALAPEEYKNSPNDESPWIEKLKKIHSDMSFYSVSEERAPQIRKSLLYSIKLRRHLALGKEIELEKYFSKNKCKTVFTGWYGDHFISAKYKLSVSELISVKGWASSIKTFTLLRSKNSNKKTGIRKKIFAKRTYKPVGLNMPQLFYENFLVETEPSKHKLEHPFKKKWKENLTIVNFPRLFTTDQSFTREEPFQLLSPFADVRLIQFIIKLHPLDLFYPEQERGLFRNSLKDILPSFIYNRTSKGGFFHKETEIKSLLNQIDFDEIKNKTPDDFLKWINLDVLEGEFLALKSKAKQLKKLNKNEVFVINLIGYLCLHCNECGNEKIK